MGDGPARLFERSDAGRLIAVIPGKRPGIDMGYAKHVVLRVKISVEDAGVTPELKLEAGPFADLKRGIAEMANQLLSGKSHNSTRLALRRRLRRGHHRLLLARSATGENEHRSEDD